MEETMPQIPLTNPSADPKKTAKAKRKEMMKKFWFAKIYSKEQALFVTKEAAKGFYVLAAIQAVVGWFVSGPLALVDAALFAFFAFLMARFQSRLAAVILLVLSFLALLSTILNIALNSGGGTNFILAALLLWLSIRAVQATFKYQSMVKGARK
ncbi:hypothetical protein IH979_00290 [Patescibacteria group bacterium]|nr:hypothetical protein [Patescibacteria group bacterium]